MDAQKPVTLQQLDRNLRGAEAEAVRWAYVDGLADFSVGFVFLAVAGLAAVEARLPEGSPWSGFMALGLPAVIIGAMVLGRFITPLWRERVTYRRMGYVALRRPHQTRTRTLAFLVGGGVAMILGAVMANSATARDWTLALQGLAVAALLAMIGWKAGAQRFLLLAALALAVGLLAAVKAPSEYVGNVWFYGCLGVVAIVSGLVTLGAFLRGTEAREA